MDDELKFSVLMAVYERDNVDNFSAALESVLIKQTLIPNEVILVVDGPVPLIMKETIEGYIQNYKGLLKVIWRRENVGLGKALNIGLEYCSNDLVARMDSDDISCFDRFEKQIEFFRKNANVDVIGGSITEFFEDHEKTEFTKKLPMSLEDINRMSKSRNPMNHVTVMFRKASVKAVGGYQHLLYLEDYYLWIRMLLQGYVLQNTEDVYVNVRTGTAMFSRRGNKEYIKGWLTLQKLLLKNKRINKLELVSNMTKLSVFIYTPPIIKELLYRHVLRK